MSPRARPLPPEERRATILTAAMPLLTELGTEATTKQIAEAAEIAEGTLFRVFPDKQALIDAAIEQVLDAEPWIAEIAAIDRSQPLRDKLIDAVVILQRRIGTVVSLMMAIGRTSPAQLHRRGRPTPPSADPVMGAVLDLVSGHADEFRAAPGEVARMLRMTTFAGTHPWITDHHPLTADEIVDLLLDGLRARPVP